MKKVLIFTLIILCIVMLSIPAMAAGSVDLSASNTWVSRGTTFTVYVNVANAGAYRVGGIEVSWDSKFDLVEGHWNIAGATLAEFVPSQKTGTFVMSESKNVSGNVFEMTFRVKDNAAFQKGNISVKLTLGLAGQGVELKDNVEITVYCAHSYGAWTQNAETGHSHTCTICYYVESGAHGFDNDCDSICDACGYYREITHQFSEEWVSDETGHWHECTVCGTKNDEAEHIPGEAAGEYTDQCCTVCGYVLSSALGHTHRYGDTYEHDEIGHWKDCIGKLSTGEECGVPTEVVVHDFDGDCDDTCDECGYQRQITHKLGQWERDGESHWKICSECGTEEFRGAHTWDKEFVKITKEATVKSTGIRVLRCMDCMQEHEEVIPKLASPDPFGGLSWWIWLAIGGGCGVLLTAVAYTVIIIVGVKKNRKRGGRFSGK